MVLSSLMRNAVAKPMSVQELCRKAESFEYDTSIPLRYWIRTANLLLKEANIYEREGNDQQAYLLLFRHANLVLGHLSKHPDASKQENRPALEALERSIPKVLDKLGGLKPRITQQFERYQRALQQREAQRTALAKDRGRQEVGRPQGRGLSTTRTESDPSFASPANSLAAGENREFAVRLAQKEFRRRETARRSTRQAGISEAEEQERRIGGVWGNWEEALANDGDAKEDELQKKIRETRSQMRDPGVERGTSRAGYGVPDSNDISSRRHGSPSYRYPNVPKREEQRYEDWIPDELPNSASLKSPEKGILKTLPQPELPPKSPLPPNRSSESASSLDHDEYFPPRPEKTPISSPPPSDSISRSATATPTSNDLQPSTFTFKPSAHLENGSPLRTIFLPPSLRSTFLKVAEPNTRANLETCGVLCGSLISNALFISRLVIPEQESTSDTCETINESALFDYCDSEDLMVLGWIHTHPSQTCFMSSRDLHTHCAYQVMMPESIAIVCAPSKNPSLVPLHVLLAIVHTLMSAARPCPLTLDGSRWGVFRLTDPPGMQAIRNCAKPGLFHPHDENDIYTDALRPGHVFEASGLEFQVVDLRPGY
ncbi:MAG: hypothetical protein M1837_002880 [Sclerophora amabilis]|nr:MAG: hypothetical protein M1837_002880 [Sclerophora amabilis]